MSDIAQEHGLGWLPGYPDVRDYTVDHAEVTPELRALGQKKSVKSMLVKAGAAEPATIALPTSVDLRPWCSPIEDQGHLGSCTAQAGVGLVEYFENRAFGKYTDTSRLFLYKATRTLLRWTGDTGAFIRTTMGAMRLFGAPPEKYWPYTDDPALFDKEPPPFCYAYAQNYRALVYYRLDPSGTVTSDLLSQIRDHLAVGLALMFGFTVYSSVGQAETTGKIPFPTKNESVLGGHAVVAVGYDDTMAIGNSNPGGEETTGALLVRNSWGTAWGGNGGYLWMPYDYVLRGLAVDWWSLLKNEWIDTGQFGL